MESSATGINLVDIILRIPPNDWGVRCCLLAAVIDTFVEEELNFAYSHHLKEQHHRTVGCTALNSKWNTSGEAFFTPTSASIACTGTCMSVCPAHTDDEGDESLFDHFDPLHVTAEAINRRHTKCGRTALHLAIDEAFHPSIIRKLLELGADPNLPFPQQSQTVEANANGEETNQKNNFYGPSFADISRLRGLGLDLSTEAIGDLGLSVRPYVSEPQSTHLGRNKRVAGRIEATTHSFLAAIGGQPPVIGCVTTEVERQLRASVSPNRRRAQTNATDETDEDRDTASTVDRATESNLPADDRDTLMLAESTIESTCERVEDVMRKLKLPEVTPRTVNSRNTPEAPNPHHGRFVSSNITTNFTLASSSSSSKHEREIVGTNPLTRFVLTASITYCDIVRRPHVFKSPATDEDERHSDYGDDANQIMSNKENGVNHDHPLPHLRDENLHSEMLRTLDLFIEKCAKARLCESKTCKGVTTSHHHVDDIRPPPPPPPPPHQYIIDPLLVAASRYGSFEDVYSVGHNSPSYPLIVKNARAGAKGKKEEEEREYDENEDTDAEGNNSKDVPHQQKKFERMNRINSKPHYSSSSSLLSYMLRQSILEKMFSFPSTQNSIVVPPHLRVQRAKRTLLTNFKRPSSLASKEEEEATAEQQNDETEGKGESAMNFPKESDNVDFSVNGEDDSHQDRHNKNVVDVNALKRSLLSSFIIFCGVANLAEDEPLELFHRFVSICDHFGVDVNEAYPTTICIPCASSAAHTCTSDPFSRAPNDSSVPISDSHSLPLLFHSKQSSAAVSYFDGKGDSPLPTALLRSLSMPMRRVTALFGLCQNPTVPPRICFEVLLSRCKKKSSGGTRGVDFGGGEGSAVGGSFDEGTSVASRKRKERNFLADFLSRTFFYFRPVSYINSPPLVPENALWGADEDGDKHTNSPGANKIISIIDLFLVKYSHQVRAGHHRIDVPADPFWGSPLCTVCEHQAFLFDIELAAAAASRSENDDRMAFAEQQEEVDNKKEKPTAEHDLQVCHDEPSLYISIIDYPSRSQSLGIITRASSLQEAEAEALAAAGLTTHQRVVVCLLTVPLPKLSPIIEHLLARGIDPNVSYEDYSLTEYLPASSKPHSDVFSGRKKGEEAVGENDCFGSGVGRGIEIEQCEGVEYDVRPLSREMRTATEERTLDFLWSHQQQLSGGRGWRLPAFLEAILPAGRRGMHSATEARGASSSNMGLPSPNNMRLSPKDRARRVDCVPCLALHSQQGITSPFRDTTTAAAAATSAAVGYLTLASSDSMTMVPKLRKYPLHELLLRSADEGKSQVLANGLTLYVSEVGDKALGLPRSVPFTSSARTLASLLSKEAVTDHLVMNRHMLFIPVVRAFLDAGLDINATDGDGHTLLTILCSSTVHFHPDNFFFLVSGGKVESRNRLLRSTAASINLQEATETGKKINEKDQSRASHKSDGSKKGERFIEVDLHACPIISCHTVPPWHRHVDIGSLPVSALRRQHRNARLLRQVCERFRDTLADHETLLDDQSLNFHENEEYAKFSHVISYLLDLQGQFVLEETLASRKAEVNADRSSSDSLSLSLMASRAVLSNEIMDGLNALSFSIQYLPTWVVLQLIDEGGAFIFPQDASETSGTAATTTQLQIPALNDDEDLERLMVAAQCPLLQLFYIRNPLKEDAEDDYTTTSTNQPVLAPVTDNPAPVSGRNEFAYSNRERIRKDSKYKRDYEDALIIVRGILKREKDERAHYERGQHFAAESFQNASSLISSSVEGQYTCTCTRRVDSTQRSKVGQKRAREDLHTYSKSASACCSSESGQHKKEVGTAASSGPSLQGGSFSLAVLNRVYDVSSIPRSVARKLGNPAYSRHLFFSPTFQSPEDQFNVPFFPFIKVTPLLLALTSRLDGLLCTSSARDLQDPSTLYDVSDADYVDIETLLADAGFAKKDTSRTKKKRTELSSHMAGSSLPNDEYGSKEVSGGGETGMKSGAAPETSEFVLPVRTQLMKFLLGFISIAAQAPEFFENNSKTLIRDIILLNGFAKKEMVMDDSDDDDEGSSSDDDVYTRTFRMLPTFSIETNEIFTNRTHASSWVLLDTELVVIIEALLRLGGFDINAISCMDDHHREIDHGGIVARSFHYVYYSALSTACAYGCPRLVTYLLSRGADPNLRPRRASASSPSSSSLNEEEPYRDMGLAWLTSSPQRPKRSICPYGWMSLGPRSLLGVPHLLVSRRTESDEADDDEGADTEGGVPQSQNEARLRVSLLGLNYGNGLWTSEKFIEEPPLAPVADLLVGDCPLSQQQQQKLSPWMIWFEATRRGQNCFLMHNDFGGIYDEDEVLEAFFSAGVRLVSPPSVCNTTTNSILHEGTSNKENLDLVMANEVTANIIALGTELDDEQEEHEEGEVNGDGGDYGERLPSFCLSQIQEEKRLPSRDGEKKNHSVNNNDKSILHPVACSDNEDSSDQSSGDNSYPICTTTYNPHTYALAGPFSSIELFLKKWAGWRVVDDAAHAMILASGESPDVASEEMASDNAYVLINNTDDIVRPRLSLRIYGSSFYYYSSRFSSSRHWSLLSRPYPLPFFTAAFMNIANTLLTERNNEVCFSSYDRITVANLFVHNAVVVGAGGTHGTWREIFMSDATRGGGYFYHASTLDRLAVDKDGFFVERNTAAQRSSRGRSNDNSRSERAEKGETEDSSPAKPEVDGGSKAVSSPYHYEFVADFMRQFPDEDKSSAGFMGGHESLTTSESTAHDEDKDEENDGRRDLVFLANLELRGLRGLCRADDESSPAKSTVNGRRVVFRAVFEACVKAFVELEDLPKLLRQLVSAYYVSEGILFCNRHDNNDDKYEHLGEVLREEDSGDTSDDEDALLNTVIFEGSPEEGTTVLAFLFEVLLSSLYAFVAVSPGLEKLTWLCNTRDHTFETAPTRFQDHGSNTLDTLIALMREVQYACSALGLDSECVFGAVRFDVDASSAALNFVPTRELLGRMFKMQVAPSDVSFKKGERKNTENADYGEQQAPCIHLPSIFTLACARQLYPEFIFHLAMRGACLNGHVGAILSERREEHLSITQLYTPNIEISAKLQGVLSCLLSVLRFAKDSRHYPLMALMRTPPAHILLTRINRQSRATLLRNGYFATPGTCFHLSCTNGALLDLLLSARYHRRQHQNQRGNITIRELQSCFLAFVRFYLYGTLEPSNRKSDLEGWGPDAGIVLGSRLFVISKSDFNSGAKGKRKTTAAVVTDQNIGVSRNSRDNLRQWRTEAEKKKRRADPYYCADVYPSLKWTLNRRTAPFFGSESGSIEDVRDADGHSLLYHAGKSQSPKVCTMIIESILLEGLPTSCTCIHRTKNAEETTDGDNTEGAATAACTCSNSPARKLYDWAPFLFFIESLPRLRSLGRSDLTDAFRGFEKLYHYNMLYSYDQQQRGISAQADGTSAAFVGQKVSPEQLEHVQRLCEENLHCFTSRQLSIVLRMGLFNPPSLLPVRGISSGHSDANNGNTINNNACDADQHPTSIYSHQQQQRQFAAPNEAKNGPREAYERIARSLLLRGRETVVRSDLEENSRSEGKDLIETLMDYGFDPNTLFEALEDVSFEQREAIALLFGSRRHNTAATFEMRLLEYLSCLGCDGAPLHYPLIPRPSFALPALPFPNSSGAIGDFGDINLYSVLVLGNRRDDDYYLCSFLRYHVKRRYRQLN